MFKPFIAAAAAALLAPAAQSHVEVPETLSWTIAPAEREPAASEVEFTIGYRSAGSQSLWSHTIRVAELEGLEPGQLAGDGVPVNFRLVREAGRFHCSGTMRRGHGNGDCRFAPDAAFAAALAQRGIATPTRSDQYQLALARVGLGLVDELDRLDYERPAIGDLVAAGIHGVSQDYVRSMSRAGQSVGTLEGLVNMRIHGVTPEVVEAFAAAGYRPDAETLVSLSIHGATPDYVRALGEPSSGRFSAQDLIGMRIHGVTGAFVRELAALGYSGLSADQLTAMRIHGVTTDFIRRAIDRRGARPSPDELVGLRIHGEH